MPRTYPRIHLRSSVSVTPNEIGTYAKRRSLFFIRFSMSGIDSDFDSGALLIKTSLWRLVLGAFFTDFLASK